MESLVRQIAVVATVGMFLVVMMGATVTTTGSGEGCGDHWPLCRGEFIPSYSLKTAIEYSHRFVTGIEGLLILATAIGALRLRRGRWDIRILVGLMVGTLFLQAGMGAWAVKATQNAGVLALHFGFSLICFATTFLVMAAIRDSTGQSVADRPPVPRNFALFAWGSVLVVYGVAYLGAYVRHASAEFACGVDWPLCNGAVAPELTDGVGAQFGHRVAAFISILVVFALVSWAYRFRESRPDIYRGAEIAVSLIVVQAAIGGLVVITKLSIFATLAHAGVMALLFVALCDVSRRTTRWSFAPAPRAASSSAGAVARLAGD